MWFAKGKRDGGVEIVKPSVDALVDAFRDNGIDFAIIKPPAKPWANVPQIARRGRLEST
jgi:hypothetical protein